MANEFGHRVLSAVLFSMVLGVVQVNAETVRGISSVGVNSGAATGGSSGECSSSDVASQNVAAQISSSFLRGDEQALRSGQAPTNHELCAPVVRSVQESVACDGAEEAARATGSGQTGSGTVGTILCKAKCFLNYLSALRAAASSMNSLISRCCAEAGGSLLEYAAPPEHMLHMCGGGPEVAAKYHACMDKPLNACTVFMYNMAVNKAKNDLQTCLNNCNESSQAAN